MKTGFEAGGRMAKLLAFLPDPEFNGGEDGDLEFQRPNIQIENELDSNSLPESLLTSPDVHESPMSLEEITCLLNATAENTNLHNESSRSPSHVFGSSKPPPFPSSSLESSGWAPEYQATCSISWDGMLCWPETPAGQNVTLPCFPHLKGVPYDTSRTAHKFCQENGTWLGKTDYRDCVPLFSQDDGSLLIQTGVYQVGYSLSLCLLTIAMIIFISFKELRCLRNRIHTHLIVTYILSDTLWIITSFMSSQSSMRTSNHHVSCITFILLHYFHMTNFSWMFVEGLYLYVLVVQTFVAENIKLKVYAAIGWGLPLLVVSGWVLAKWLNQPEQITNVSDPEFGANPVCLWLNVSVYDWIYKAPFIFILLTNIVFLSQIMWVLITKLRSAMNPETQQSRKAAKALLVLMPLLGITYLLFLAGSQQVPVYEYIRALLISTQGFLVALFYCFLNGEVRVALRHQWNRIREARPSFSCCGCEFDSGRQHMQQMRDWSPRSRTESIRLYTPSGHTFRKRESSASDATSMTILHHGGSLNGSNQFPTITSLNRNNRLSTTLVSSKLPNLNELNNSVV